MNRRRLRTLNTLVRVRRRQEDLKAQAFARAQRDVQNAVEQRAGLEVYQRRMLDRAGELMQGEEVDASALRLVYQYERHLGRLVVERDAQIRQLEKVADSKRGDLESALKNRRMVERLETHAVERYRRFRSILEQKQHDEIAGARAVRNDTGVQS